MTQPSTGQARRRGLKSASRGGRGEARSATSPDKEKVRGSFFVSNLNVLPAVNKKIIKLGVCSIRQHSCLCCIVGCDTKF